MKRFLLVLIVILCTGCLDIRKSSKEVIIATTLNSKYQLTNKNSSGYNYYLPSNLKREKLKGNSNELLKDKYYDYYMYVDLVSYYNKVNVDYDVDNNIYYSTILNHDNKNGILNIYKENDKYLIEVFYNYGKIEVKVVKKDINLAIANALTVLSSIDYKDDIIKKMMEENILNSKEEIIDIFKKEEDENHDYLTEGNDNHMDEEEVIDPDVIN